VRGYDSGYGSVADSRVHGNETSVCHKSGGILDQLSDFQLLEWWCAPWS
jgi:hypothetical protein